MAALTRLIRTLSSRLSRSSQTNARQAIGLSRGATLKRARQQHRRAIDLRRLRGPSPSREKIHGPRTCLVRLLHTALCACEEPDQLAAGRRRSTERLWIVRLGSSDASGSKSGGGRLNKHCTRVGVWRHRVMESGLTEGRVSCDRRDVLGVCVRGALLQYNQEILVERGRGTYTYACGDMRDWR